MKKLLFLLIGFSILSCSSSDDSSDVANPFFMKFKYDGVQYLNGQYYPSWNQLIKIESNHQLMTINVRADENTKRCSIIFNKYGDFVRAICYDNVDPYGGTKYNYALVAGEHFHFELESIDETAQTVKGNFSGRLYKDRYDLNSESIELEGSFYNEYWYTEDDRGYSGVIAKIDGTDWHSIAYNDVVENHYLDNPVYNYNDPLAAGIYLQQFVGDDRYRILIGYENQVGVRDFTGSAAGTFVRLSKYNPVSGVFEDFQTLSGTIVITEKLPASFTASRYVGNFSFTAVDPSNPSHTIQITDGSFNFNGHL
jgi:hypothetical protein